MTSPAGTPVPSETASEQAGAGGPILLQDSNLLDNLAHFNRERIPERVVFASGVGAHGYFELSRDLSSYTQASALTTLNVSIQVFCRFSMALEDKGFPETILDWRGIACKFYTTEGNWDLITGTGLVFPIRDPMLYPSLIRSHKRNPQTNLFDMNMLWDFRSLRPETIFSTLTLLSDIGLPDGYRHMSTSTTNVFKLINARGEVTLCKFHLVTNQGWKNLTITQAAQLMAIDQSYATRDLFESIATRNFPSWTVSVQLMTLEQASKYPWNPVDPTKMWLFDDHPLIPIGTVVLNRNVANYFAETEMVAFSPSNLPRGVELFLEPLSSGMAFAFKDAQRYRLGTNFEQLPINRPLVPVNSYFRDGGCNMQNFDGSPNYFPNSFNGPAVVGSSGGISATEKIIKALVARWDTGPDGDNYSQAKIWLRGLSQGERERMVGNIALYLSYATVSVRERMFQQFGNVSSTLEIDMRQAVSASLEILQGSRVWDSVSNS